MKKLLKQFIVQEKNFLTKETLVNHILLREVMVKLDSSFSYQSGFEIGSGLTFCVSADCGYSVLQTHCVEAMFMSFGNHYCEKIDVNDDATFGIGPGFGTEEISEKL